MKLGTICLLVATIAILSLNVSYAQQFGNYQDYFDYYNIEVIDAPGVDITFPTWAQPNPSQDQTDLNYWVNEVLPFEQDRHADKYLVYPEHGVVLPIVEPDDSDKALISAGNPFDHFEYLERGGLYYFGRSPDVSKGNMVIAAHSSFEQNQPGRYKTVFQALPISRKGDKIFLYIKNNAGSYDFYEYIIEKSFETEATNVSILRHTSDKYMLTTYGCYVIGSSEDRRVNQALLADTQLAHSTLQPREHAAAGEVADTDSINQRNFIAKIASITQPMQQSQDSSPYTKSTPQENKATKDDKKHNPATTILAKRAAIAAAKHKRDMIKKQPKEPRHMPQTPSTDPTNDPQTLIATIQTRNAAIAAAAPTTSSTPPAAPVHYAPRSTSHKAQLYAMLRQRNQYVFDGTLPHDIVKARIADRIRTKTATADRIHAAASSKAPTTTTSSTSSDTHYTSYLSTRIITAARQNLTLAKTLMDKIETMLASTPKASTAKTQEKQRLLQQMHHALQTMVEKG